MDLYQQPFQRFLKPLHISASSVLVVALFGSSLLPGEFAKASSLQGKVLSAKAQAAQAQAKSKSFPKILEVIGPVENRKNPEQKVSPQLKIVDGLSLSLKEKSLVKVKLDEKRTLTAYGPTDFKIPSISWENRDFPEIVLESGAVRLEVLGQPFPFLLKSPLFELAPPEGESVFTFDPKRALADAMVLKGELEFHALNSDEGVTLKSGQKVTFLGILEEGEISYDLLLQGRKIPKGRLQAVQAISKEDLHNFSAKLDQERRQELAKKMSQKARAEQQRKSKALCWKPMAQLNECQWKKQKNECYRSRCAADAQWKDTQKVDNSSCTTSTPKVAPCDY